MSRKTALNLLIIFTLIGSLVVGLQAVEVAEANFLPVASVNHIWSPENKTYNSNLLTLNVSVDYFVTKAEDRWIAYSLDGAENVTLTGTEYPIDLAWKRINITTPLPKLSEGSHRLDVYAQFSTPINFSTPHSRTVFFTIDTTMPTPSLNPTTTPTPSPTITPTATPSTLPTPSPSLTPSLTSTPTLSPTNSPTQQPTPSLEPTATVPEFPTWIILLLTIVTALTAIIVIRNKKQKQS